MRQNNGKFSSVFYTDINLGYVNFSSVPYKKVMIHQGIYQNYFHSIYIFTLTRLYLYL